MNRLLVDPAEYEKDAELMLGMANGNVYYRQPGIKDVHDGQIMVRLKLKRFLVLDYSFEPTRDEINTASKNSHIVIYTGAGKTKCNAPGCNKIGIPICLYDSNPDGTNSLYIRTGQCFSCQRRLNEKRRSRKKQHPSMEGIVENGTGSGTGSKKEDTTTSPSIIYALGPNTKKFKYNSGAILELKDDAVVVNGSIDGIKSYKEGYSLQEIGADLYQTSQEAAVVAQQLIERSASITAAAAVAAMGSPTSMMNDDSSTPIENGNSSSIVTKSVATNIPSAPTLSKESVDEIMGLYQNAFQSLNTSIFLLAQWKITWDAAHNNSSSNNQPPLGLDSQTCKNDPLDQSVMSSDIRYVTPNTKENDAVQVDEKMKPKSILVETPSLNKDLPYETANVFTILENRHGDHTKTQPSVPTIVSQSNNVPIEITHDDISSTIATYPKECFDNTVNSNNTSTNTKDDGGKNMEYLFQPNNISLVSVFENHPLKEANCTEKDENQPLQLYDEV